MRVTAFHIVPADPDNKINLNTLDPGNPGKFQVKSIGGLDADEIRRKFAGRGVSSGKKFYNRSLGVREVPVLMNLNPRFGQNESYSQLRDEVYRMISSSRTGQVEIHFLDGVNVVAILTGTIDKVEASLWEEQPAVQITISCEYPLPAAPVRTVLDLDTIATPGEIHVNDPLSTAEHGLVFNLRFTEGPAYFEMYDSTGDWTFKITPPEGFNDDDQLIVSSEYNNKKVYLVRGEDLLGLADVISARSTWPLVFPGENEFLCSTDNVEWTYIGHHPTYWGI